MSEKKKTTTKIEEDVLGVPPSKEKIGRTLTKRKTIFGEILFPTLTCHTTVA